MPRDASETRERLIVAAEALFASRGIHQAATRDITDNAGQRNTSALTYHFGSRSAVLQEILVYHGDPIDVLRGEAIVEPIDAMSTRDLVAALLVAYAHSLATSRGRAYLRIVVQLTGQFPGWREERAVNPANLRRILTTLETRIEADRAIAGERIVGVLMLMTAAYAERARMVDQGAKLELSQTQFVTNLADVIVASLEAAVGASVQAKICGGAARR